MKSRKKIIRLKYGKQVRLTLVAELRIYVCVSLPEIPEKMIQSFTQTTILIHNKYYTKVILSGPETLVVYGKCENAKFVTKNETVHTHVSTQHTQQISSFSPKFSLLVWLGNIKWKSNQDTVWFLPLQKKERGLFWDGRM